MTAETFTPIASLAGGAMIGAAAVLLLALKGRVAGVSGIAARLLPPYADHEFGGRSAFILGLVATPFGFHLATGVTPALTLEASPVLIAAAGLLVGFGAVWGNGCTSGHGVCGLSRLSIRSLVATLTFMATATVTLFLLRHVL